MKRKPGVRANERKRSSAEIGFGRQMNEQHPGRTADCAGAIAAAADIVGEEHVAAAAPVLLPVAGFDLQCAGKHDKKLGAWRPGASLGTSLRASPSRSCSGPVMSLSGGRYRPRRIPRGRGWRKNRKRGVAVAAWLCLLHAGDDRCVRGAQRCRVRGGIDCHADAGLHPAGIDGRIRYDGADCQSPRYTN